MHILGPQFKCGMHILVPQFKPRKWKVHTGSTLQISFHALRHSHKARHRALLAIRDLSSVLLFLFNSMSSSIGLLRECKSLSRLHFTYERGKNSKQTHTHHLNSERTSSSIADIWLSWQHQTEVFNLAHLYAYIYIHIYMWYWNTRHSTEHIYTKSLRKQGQEPELVQNPGSLARIAMSGKFSFARRRIC